MTENKHPIYTMTFASVYPMYLQKAEKKGRSKAEVDQIIRWLTGYTQEGIDQQINVGSTFEAFFDQAPHLNDNVHLITGSICGYKVQEIEDDLMRKVRYLDKLVDELAKGKVMDKILRKAK